MPLGINIFENLKEDPTLNLLVPYLAKIFDFSINNVP